MTTSKQVKVRRADGNRHGTAADADRVDADVRKGKGSATVRQQMHVAYQQAQQHAAQHKHHGSGNMATSSRMRTRARSPLRCMAVTAIRCLRCERHESAKKHGGSDLTTLKVVYGERFVAQRNAIRACMQRVRACNGLRGHMMRSDHML